jgi:hypothetical protein
MAYVDDSILEDENQQSGAVVPGGGNSVANPAAGGQPSPGAGQKKTPGNFADLGEYLRVNTPQEFGSKVAGKIGGDIEQGQQALDQSANEFKARADSSKVQDTNNLISQVDTNPQAIDANAFAGLRDASYSGPTSLSDASDLSGKITGSANTAVSKANASKTEGGRFALLDNYFGRSDYSQGQKALDNLLIQNDPNSKQAFDQMRQNAQGLQQNVNNATQDLNSYGAQAKGITDATRGAARSAVGIDDAGNVTGEGALGRLKSELENNYQSRLTKQQSDQAAIQQALASNDFSQLTPEQKAVLGFDRSDIDGYYMADPTAFLSTNQLTQTGVTSQEQAARQAALANLGGVENPLSGAADVGSQVTDPGVKYDFSALQGAIGRGRQQFNSEVNAALNDNNYQAPTISDRGTTFQPGGGPMSALSQIQQRINSVQANINAGGSYADNLPLLNSLNQAKSKIQSDINKITNDLQKKYGVGGAASSSGQGLGGFMSNDSSAVKK